MSKLFLLIKRCCSSIVHFYHMIYNFFIFIFNKVIFSDSIFSVTVNGVLHLNNKGFCQLGSNVRINSGIRYNPIGGSDGTWFFIAKGARLNIGSGVGISNTTIVCTESIVIEDNVFVGGNCKIYDTDFHSIYYSRRILKDDYDVKSSPVRIGCGSFIGGHTIILKGVTIGERAVIGAGSVVTRDIPSDEIWAGNPVKFIKKLNENKQGDN